MHPATEVWTWIRCPCRQDDPNADGSTAICLFVKIERYSATRLQIVLPRKAKIGTLLSAELHDELIVARVTATESRPGVGWLTECERVTPLLDQVRNETHLTSAV